MSNEQFLNFLDKDLPLSRLRKLIFSLNINILMSLDRTQIMNEARKMFLANKGRRDVITYFKMKGIEEAEAESMATEAYKSIREIRQAMIAEAQNNNGNTGYAQPASSGSSSGAIISIVLGLIICGGGLAASMGTDRIFYGAVLVGGGMVLKGIIGLAT